MLRNLTVICWLLTLSTTTGAAAQDRVSELDDLHRAVMQVAKQHYPKATSHVFKNRIHFEHNTRVYVVPGLGKGKPSLTNLTEVRGPLNNGVHCDIYLMPGVADIQRADGTRDRGPFKELFLTPKSQFKECQLHVVLRVPAGQNATIPKGFMVELETLLRRFDKHLSD